MRLIVIVGALLGLGTAVVGIVSMRSDIQIIIAAVGFFAAMILFGIDAVLSRLDKQWNFLLDIEDHLRGRKRGD